MRDILLASRGFLTRLRHNQAGNTLAIVAAAVIPLAGLIGGGVDMSRAYMARARLQQACDAAALAGRRAMTGASMSASDIAEARKFFDFNFRQGTFGTAAFTPTIRSKPNETTTVEVTAATSIPTSIMRIFGYETMALSVNCDSRFDIGNTDVMLVLDTTGSMNASRMSALRKAVKDFYDTLGPGNNSTGRIRYGFVPYSGTVNVGYLLPKSALVGGTAGDTWDYQTRRQTYYFNTASTTTTCYRKYNSSQCRSTRAAAENDSGSNRSLSQCQNWGNTSTSVSGNYPNTVTKIAYTPESWNNTTPFPSSGNNNRSCVRKEVTTTHATGTTGGTGWTSMGWEYGQFPLMVSDYVKGIQVPNPAQTSGNSTWAGCIEERGTISTINAASALTVPADAYDLQIDTAATSTQTRWRPYWPDAVFNRTSSTNGSSLSSLNSACPSSARKLMSYASRDSAPTEDSSLSSFNSYIDGLTANGYTFHDIGMIWGARLLSPTGLFAAENASAPNGFTISRHLIFMTDGEMNANSSAYSAWGLQKLDGREAPTSTNNLTSVHNRRLDIICDAAKRQGYTVWVIAFAESSGYSTQVQNCASSANHRALAMDADELSETFTNIARNIGGLRLSQ